MMMIVASQSNEGGVQKMHLPWQIRRSFFFFFLVVVVVVRHDHICLGHYYMYAFRYLLSYQGSGEGKESSWSVCRVPTQSGPSFSPIKKMVGLLWSQRRYVLFAAGWTCTKNEEGVFRRAMIIHNNNNGNIIHGRFVGGKKKKRECLATDRSQHGGGFDISYNENI
jgi:hypothetical protein